MAQDKGLSIGKTAFNRMLRNPIYKGKIVVTELGDEEEQMVMGIHEAIISAELFDKVQNVLAKVLVKNMCRVEKVNYRDELPLRGMLECPKCQSMWTESGSKGNGGVYFYYHCQHGCKERVKAEAANESFLDYLKIFKVHSEVSNLYLAIMEDIFKTKEGDREKEINRLQKSINELNTKLLKIDEMFINGDLERDSYQRVKGTTKNEIQRLQSSIEQLRTNDTNFMKYCRYGMNFLTNLDTCY